MNMCTVCPLRDRHSILSTKQKEPTFYSQRQVLVFFKSACIYDIPYRGQLRIGGIMEYCSTPYVGLTRKNMAAIHSHVSLARDETIN